MTALVGEGIPAFSEWPSSAGDVAAYDPVRSPSLPSSRGIEIGFYYFVGRDFVWEPMGVPTARFCLSWS